MGRSFTPEQREAAALRIQQWKPWEKSTGPRTPEGKAISSMNRFEGAKQKKQRAGKRLIRHCLKLFDHINLEHRRMLWLEERIKAGLPATAWHMQRAQLPNASILQSGRVLEGPMPDFDWMQK